jgi:hypothetical protein
MKHGGRAKGTPNKTTAATKMIVATLVESELTYIASHINELTVKERAEILTKIISYVIPKNHHVEQDPPNKANLPTWMQ